jgi:hypothetical protein
LGGQVTPTRSVGPAAAKRSRRRVVSAGRSNGHHHAQETGIPKAPVHPALTALLQNPFGRSSQGDDVHEDHIFRTCARGDRARSVRFSP